MARKHDPFADVGEVAAYLMTLIAIVAGVCLALVLSTRSSSDRRNGQEVRAAAPSDGQIEHGQLDSERQAVPFDRTIERVEILPGPLGSLVHRLSLVNAARRYALARTVVKSVPSTGGAPHADRARC
jgi:hypothetical protein